MASHWAWRTRSIATSRATSECSWCSSLHHCMLIGVCSVHGLKSIGYVQVHPYVPPPQKKRISAETSARQQTKMETSSSNACLAIGFAGLALVAAFALPYFYNRP